MARPTARVLSLLELLQSGGVRTVAELAGRLGVDERTVRRYADHLIDLDVPVESVRGRYGGYRLGSGYRMPPLMLSDDEALAVLLGLVVSEHGREADWLEEDWRSAIQQARWVVARTAHGVVGVARSSQDPESPERRYIGAVWVAPEFRRLGVGRRLVRWLIDRERKSGIREILLWVIDSNVYARSFYFRMGFRSTGRVQPVPGGENR